MIEIKVYFENMTLTIPVNDKTAKEMTEIYQKAFQNEACKCLVFEKPDGTSHIIQKSHVIFMEISEDNARTKNNSN